MTMITPEKLLRSLRTLQHRVTAEPELAQRAHDNVGPSIRIEVEADTLEQVRMAVEAEAEAVLLDNISPDEMRQAVAMVDGRAKLEASGGMTLETTRAVAETGVDYISVDALTHSARALDISAAALMTHYDTGHTNENC